MTVHIKELFDLSGRVAIVTGGSRGLGKEMAVGLAEAGASLMLCARREQWLTPTVNELRAGGFRVEGMTCNVANPEQVQAVVDATVAAYGKIDILVNNAGVSWGEHPEAMPLDKWQKVIDINLTGAFLFAQAAGREMLKREYGRIINIASLSTFVALYEVAAYSASKAAVASLTKSLAIEWSPRGVNVNAIAPGVFPTDLNRKLIEGTPRGNELLMRTPLRRFGRAGDLALVVGSSAMLGDLGSN